MRLVLPLSFRFTAWKNSNSRMCMDCLLLLFLPASRLLFASVSPLLHPRSSAIFHPCFTPVVRSCSLPLFPVSASPLFATPCSPPLIIRGVHPCFPRTVRFLHAPRRSPSLCLLRGMLIIPYNWLKLHRIPIFLSFVIMNTRFIIIFLLWFFFF